MASDVITQAIMFIAVLGIAAGLIVAFKNYTDETEAVFVEKGDKYNQVLQTDIAIDSFHYNNATDTLYLYVRNTGKTVMKTGDIDVYIDGVRLPRQAANRTIEVTEDTDTINPGIWDPKEILLIRAYIELNSSLSHTAMVMSPYEVRATETFSI
jgi:archaellum component FlaG (FlaF/FlaG flagellin family)